MREEIKDIKKRRERLSIKIREYVYKNKNAYELVVEYNNLTTQLVQMGCKVSIQTEHLKLDNWTPSGYKFAPTPMQPIKTRSKLLENTNKVITNIQKPTQGPTRESIKPKQDSFTLCLAWTEVDGEIEPTQLQKVKDYFNDLGMQVCDQETHKNGNCTERILKYEFTGSEDSFRMLKLCVQFVIDSLAQTDFDRFNIAVYGKKVNK